MTIVIGCALTAAWLAAGGWAFSAFLDDDEITQDVTGILFFFCLLLAPFAAGMAVFIRQKSEREAAK
jgi:membrane protein DedA with SNARE-associated domain